MAHRKTRLLKFTTLAIFLLTSCLLESCLFKDYGAEGEKCSDKAVCLAGLVCDNYDNICRKLGSTDGGGDAKIVITVDPYTDTPLTMDFGTVKNKIDRLVGTVTISNHMKRELTVESIALTLTSSSDYTLANMKIGDVPVYPPFILRDNGQDILTFNVIFEPNTVGQITGTIEIVNNDTDNPKTSITIIAAGANSNGQPCTGTAQCASGFCVNNFCCNENCDGKCVRCDIPDYLGACTYADETYNCKNPICDSESTAYKAWTCDGNGSCADRGAVRCDPYFCQAGKCLDSCTDQNQCVPGGACCSKSCIDISTYINTCQDATYLGEHEGDRACYSLCNASGGWRDLATLSGNRSMWYSGRAIRIGSIDKVFGCYEKIIAHKIKFTVPTDVVYEVCAYKGGSCPNPTVFACKQASGSSVELEISQMREPFDYWISVQWKGGSSCDSWSLLVEWSKC